MGKQPLRRGCEWMVFRKAEIEALKERVAQIAPDNVPGAATPDVRGQFAVERGMSAFLSFTELALKAGAGASVSTPSEKPVPASGETVPAGEGDELYLDENPLPPEELGKRQNPGNEAVPKAVPRDSAPPKHKAAMTGAAAGATGAADDDAVSKVHEDHKEWVRKVHNYDVGGMTEKGADDTVNDRNGVRKITIASNQNADAKKNKKKQADDTMRYLLLQQQLQDQIEAINARIGEIDARVGEIDQRLAEINAQRAALEDVERLHKSGELDPTNEAHRAKMREAGLDPDEGDLDAALRERNTALAEEEARLKGERDGLLAERGELATTRDKLAEAKENLDANPDSPAALAAAQEVYEQGKAVTATMVDQRVEIIGTEAELFAVQLEQIDAPQGSPEYIAQIDALIDGLTENTKSDLLTASDTDEALKDRLRIDYFENEYEMLQSEKGNPEYQTWLRELTGQLDDRTKELLLASEDTPADVRAILAEDQPKNVDDLRVQRFMEAHTKASTDTDMEALKKLAAELTPEERAIVEQDAEAKAYLESLDNPAQDQGSPVRTAALSAGTPSP